MHDGADTHAFLGDVLYIFIEAPTFVRVRYRMRYLLKKNSGGETRCVLINTFNKKISSLFGIFGGPFCSSASRLGIHTTTRGKHRGLSHGRGWCAAASYIFGGQQLQELFCLR